MYSIAFPWLSIRIFALVVWRPAQWIEIKKWLQLHIKQKLYYANHHSYSIVQAKCLLLLMWHIIAPVFGHGVQCTAQFGIASQVHHRYIRIVQIFVSQQWSIVEITANANKYIILLVKQANAHFEWRLNLLLSSQKYVNSENLSIYFGFATFCLLQKKWVKYILVLYISWCVGLIIEK